MAHTNSTANYNLPQFLPTDKPAWLVDVNPAYATIDTAIKNASDAAGNAQGDATQALSDAAGAQATATQANTKADGAIASIAESFLDTATYAVGEYVIFNNILYVCSEPVTTPGPWTGSVNWTRASVDSIATEINSNLNALSGDMYGNKIPISETDPTTISNKLSILDGALIVRNFTTTYTAPANGFANLTPSSFITIPDGYSIVGIAGYNTNNQYIFVSALDLINFTGEWAILLKNISNSAHSHDFSIRVLFAKTSLL